MTVPIQIRLDKEQVEHIKHIARHIAIEKNRDVNWRDLVRQAIAEQFPVPKEKNDVNKKRTI